MFNKLIIAIVKTLIVIFGWESRGKSSAIKAIARRWGIKVADECWDVDDSKDDVGFVGEGDPGSDQKDKIEAHIKNGCKVIVCASRTRGGTTDNISNLAAQYGYRVIWTSNYSVDQGSLKPLGFNTDVIEEQCRQKNDLFADAMMVLIHRALTD